MSNFVFNDNRTFIENSVAKPIIIECTPDLNIDLQPDLSLFIELPNRTIQVKDKVVKSSIISTIGLSGILLKKLLEGNAVLEDTLLDLITPLLKDNISHFLFYLDSDTGDAEAIVVQPMFDRHLDPIPVPNTSDELKLYQCTSHLPVSPDRNYNVSNFDHDQTMKVFRLNLSRVEDNDKPIYPIVHNKSSIAWQDKWDQRASIFIRQFGIDILLPRNYGKGEYKPVDNILSHVDFLINKLDIEKDYDEEYNEMLSAKLPNKGQKFMMETPFADHKLKTILAKIASVREDLKPAEVNAISQCLGYMVAKKIHCCSECRYMDEETL